jgi:hypothetical protein
MGNVYLDVKSCCQSVGGKVLDAIQSSDCCLELLLSKITRGWAPNGPKSSKFDIFTETENSYTGYSGLGKI